MSNIFSTVSGNRPKRNKFDLSHEKKMSLKMGTLTPFMVQEVIPGDNFKVQTEMLMRLQPMLAPIYHRVRVKTDYYFVPNRLVWDNWQKFITGGDKGTDTSVHPYIQLTEANGLNMIKGTLWDYLGLPTLDGAAPGYGNGPKVNALPFRAYQLIYNEYYRDQNLIDEIEIYKGDGDSINNGDWVNLITMKKRAWEKDYFTSCLPWAQKGGAVVTPTTIDNSINSTATDVNGAPLTAGSPLQIAAGGGINITDSAGNAAVINNAESIGININDLRVSVRLQEWLEKNARAGSRYIESILAHFGILSSDARLQRPEYLGGSINPIVISEVLSTFQNADDSGYPQGTMAGHGISTGGNGGFKRKFEEHGFVMGIMTILPRTAYQQGLPKQYTRFDKFDYAWPGFAQLGEQEVTNEELYYQPAGGALNKETFGYQSRYAEYKYQASTVHGDFKDNLSFWHMGRIFSAPPVLNKSFIEADPTKRIFAVEDENEDEILCQLYNRVDALRPLPYFNSPTL